MTNNKFEGNVANHLSPNSERRDKKGGIKINLLPKRTDDPRAAIFTLIFRMFSTFSSTSKIDNDKSHLSASIGHVAKVTSNRILRGSVLLLLWHATIMRLAEERVRSSDGEREREEDEGEAETSSRSSPPLDAAFPRVH